MNGALQAGFSMFGERYTSTTGNWLYRLGKKTHRYHGRERMVSPDYREILI
jgi:hypothetical protein